MNGTAIAENLWQLRPWTLPLAIALYLVPILRLISFPVAFGGRHFMRLNRLFGCWEHLAWPLRDSVIALFLAGGALWNGWQGIWRAEWRYFLVAATAIALLFLGHGMRLWRKGAHRRLLEFIRRFPAIHPQEFFDHLLCSAGAIRHRLPDEPFAMIDPGAIDFRAGKPAGRGIGIFSLLAGIWSTIWLARLVLIARAEEKPEFLRTVASSLAVIWGTRISQLMRAAVTVEGREKLPATADGVQIFLFTHMSFLDFALAALALAARPAGPGSIASGHHCPSFLLAKDHFRDNILFYRILGIGRVAEALGMTFVDRRGGTPEGARRVEEAAVGKLLAGEGPLAIFPQGTRAVGLSGARGERLDGAYYTVGSRERIRADGKHLKKGAAYIAAEAARAIAAAGTPTPVWILPIAIAGTAIACPRGSVRILSNIPIRLRAGDPIAVGTPPGEASSAEHLHVRIDCALKGTGRVHAELERRFFEDMRGIVDPMKVEEVAIAMKPWRGEDYLVHAILDAIYACPPPCWRPFVGKLIHSLLNFSSREELLAFKGTVADAVRL